MTNDGPNAELDLLNAGFGCGERLRFVDSPLGGRVAEMSFHGARAIVALQGGHVLSYVPAGGGDVLWVSPLARLGTSKAVRGGIPVCWPWFAQHPTDPSAPAHGFVRTVPWDVVGSGANETGTRLRLSCPFPEAERARWASIADLGLEIVLGEQLGVTLVTRNLSAQPLKITEALHSYFAISDIADVEVSGHDGQGYIDKLDGNRVKRQEGGIRFAGEVDRIYADTSPAVQVIDERARRRILIMKSGSASTVVWNPWIAKSERMGDMGPGGYRRMVCVETANCGDTVVAIAPGDMHRMRVEISASPV